MVEEAVRSQKLGRKLGRANNNPPMAEFGMRILGAHIPTLRCDSLQLPY